MPLPFSLAEFLQIFRDYNAAVWPAQFMLYALGLALVLATQFRADASRRLVSVGLAFLWVWMGAVYHLGFFSRINSAAFAFGIIFLVQAALLLFWGFRRRRASSERVDRMRYVAGAALLAYAFLAYPVLNVVFGHSYPAAPTFGLPCPTTIATLGLLLWTAPYPPVWLFTIPVAWALVGTSAAFLLGMWEDLGLLVAALLTVLVLVRQARPGRVHSIPQ